MHFASTKYNNGTDWSTLFLSPPESRDGLRGFPRGFPILGLFQSRNEWYSLINGKHHRAVGVTCAHLIMVI